MAMDVSGSPGRVSAIFQASTSEAGVLFHNAVTRVLVTRPERALR